MFWGGVEAGKKTFEDVITKTHSTISSASQSLKPGIQKATESVSATTSEIME